MKTHLRNGDWSFHEIDQKEYEKLVKIGKIHNSDVFAEGEATGHLHAVKTAGNMTIHKLPDMSYVISLDDDAVATHPEHSMKVDLKVPKKKYLLYQRREKDWFSLVTRRVLD